MADMNCHKVYEVLMSILSKYTQLRLAFLARKFTCGYDQMRFTSSIIHLPNYILSLYRLFIFTTTMFNLTHPVNFPCGRKPEQPEKHDFQQSVD